MPIDIGATILACRKRKSLTQEQLADMLGISPGAVSKWENGASTPDISLLRPLARVLDTTVDYLLSFQKELSDAEVAAIKLELNDIFLNNGFLSGECKCKEYLREYPNSNALKNVIAGLIEVYGIKWDKNADSVWNGNADQTIEKNIQYVLSLYQEIIDSGDAKYGHSLFWSSR